MPGASALLVDVQTGRMLDSAGAVDLGAAPGSALKPLFLQAALAAGVVRAEDKVSCHGTLQVGMHHLGCTHPRSLVVLDAASALPASCNTYFAALADRMPPALVLSTLRSYGMQAGVAMSDPNSRKLLVLGVEGVTVSPRQLAEAYRRLAARLHHRSAADTLVHAAMLQSVASGMAHGAFTAGVDVAGKTGSVDGGPGGRGVGWFAGIVQSPGKPERVLVVRVLGGNGNDAAVLAHRVLANEEGSR